MSKQRRHVCCILGNIFDLVTRIGIRYCKQTVSQNFHKPEDEVSLAKDIWASDQQWKTAVKRAPFRSNANNNLLPNYRLPIEGLR